MSLLESPIGCVPIVWNNADWLDLAPETPAETVLDEIARLGFAGTQHGRGFPEGDVLREALARRGLRFAELYSALDATEDGLAPERPTSPDATLAGSSPVAARCSSSPSTSAGSETNGPGASRMALRAGPKRRSTRWRSCCEELAAAAPDGVRVAFHPHAGTWVEDPEEVAALAERLPGTGAGLCLDVGHCLVGGGDPVDAIGRYGSLVTHVHAKDVDPAVLARLRNGELTGLGGAVRERLFTELGNGALDLDGVLRGLDRIGYAGWLMVEQDSSSLHPSEAAAIGRRVLEYARRAAVREAVA